MRVGILTFGRKHGRKTGTIGSSILRGHWLQEHWEGSELWTEGRKFDAILFQKVYWKEYFDVYDGVKILDLCDPDWLGPAVPPGEMLLEEFLKPMGIGQVEAARRLEISLNRLNEIVLGKRGITADTALRLARLFKTSAQFWMRLQADWDLHLAIRARRAS